MFRLKTDGMCVEKKINKKKIELLKGFWEISSKGNLQNHITTNMDLLKHFIKLSNVSSSKFNPVSLVKQYKEKVKLTAKLNKKSKFFGTVEMNVNHPFSNYPFLKI